MPDGQQLGGGGGVGGRPAQVEVQAQRAGMLAGVLVQRGEGEAEERVGVGGRAACAPPHRLTQISNQRGQQS